MCQRLGIAAALLGDPQTVMFDEPINGLDPDGILWIRNLMRSLAAQGRTVFLSSHVMSEMAQTADHLLIIGRGRIIADTSVADLVGRQVGGGVRVRSTEQSHLADTLARQGRESSPPLTEPSSAPGWIPSPSARPPPPAPSV
jgi:ABC-2 type transport system ATP-binding protein